MEKQKIIIENEVKILKAIILSGEGGYEPGDIKEDIEKFKRENGVARCVMIWCGSTEAYMPPGAVHESLTIFEEGLKSNDPSISPSMPPEVRCSAKMRSSCSCALGS